MMQVTARSGRTAILMATWNGEKYLRAQLDSLFSQTEQSWDLIVSDDCSTDSTPVILQEYAWRHPQKMHLLVKETSSGSAKNNFFRLLESAEGYDWLLFCDQDDVWKPEKVAKTLSAMRRLENDDRHIPCLIYTDLTVASEDLTVLRESFWRSSMIDPTRNELRQLIIQNVVTGCTTAINDTLRKMALLPTVRENILMHDGWCALWASALGRISFVPEQTVFYRQHGNNTVGARDVRSLHYILHCLQRRQQNQRALLNAEQQAAAFLSAAKPFLDPKQIRLLEDFSSLQKKSKAVRLLTVLRHGIWLSGWRRKIGEILEL